MHLGVGDIPVGGHRVTLEGATWAVDAAREAAGGEVSSVTGELVLREVGSGVLSVTGTARLLASLPCDRCGEAVTADVHTDVDLSYTPLVSRAKPSASDEEEIELGEDELDEGWYEGTTLDMSAVLCEAFSLAWPARTVCSDTTSCEQRASELLEAGKIASSPFAALRGIADA